ncbi:MAG: sulfatase-like hydrolase/transferase, partial [Kofleriaceae bacterium]|nr:sulfatase-like hydrolase/transferase [Kofleriaceae bacterium]
PGTGLRIDLVANRLRFHRFDRGLVVDWRDASFRKYDLAYSSPWRPVVGGAHIDGGQANVTVPWAGGAARLRLRTDASKPVRISIDGKAAKLERPAPTGGGPARLDDFYSVPVLAAGEHVIRLTSDKRTLFTELEMMPAAAGVDALCPAAQVPAPADQLPRAPLQQLLIELPADATLSFEPRGDSRAHGSVALVTEHSDGSLSTETQLWQGTAGAGMVHIALPAKANTLARLAFTSDACAMSWGKVTIDAPAPGPAVTPVAPFENVVLVVVDTLRADRLAVYGQTRIATPRITQAVTDHGLVMLRNQSMAPSSPPSHATIQTGQIPRVHGAAGDKGEIKPNTPVLSAIARAAGFWTGYVGNNDFAMARFRSVGKWHEFHTPTREKEGVDCKAVVRRTLAMVDTALAAKQRFFISALPVEPHAPYRFHKGITEKYFAGPFDPPFGREVTGDHLDKFKTLSLGPHSMDQLRGLHDGEVEYFDGCFGALQDGLQQRGVADKTAIILTSDHGEGLGERGGRVGHAYSLNHELVSVPWLIIGSQLRPGVMQEVSSNADIAPTVLDLLGLPADARMQGSSVMAALQRGGAALPRVVASEYGKALALRAGNWHYLVDYDGTATLYNIVDDPQEKRDQSAHHPLWLRYMREAAGFYLGHRVQWRAASWGSLGNFAATNPLLKDAHGG